jgi:hypothetical protein
MPQFHNFSPGMAPKANRTVAIARESIRRLTILEGKIKALDQSE